MIRLCSARGCHEQAVSEGKCPEHAAEAKARRGTRAIYDTKRWRIARRHQLAEHPLCQCGEIAEPPRENCGALATEVHHRHELEQGGAPFAPDNLVSMSHACHARITNQKGDAAAA